MLINNELNFYYNLIAVFIFIWKNLYKHILSFNKCYLYSMAGDYLNKKLLFETLGEEKFHWPIQITPD